MIASKQPAQAKALPREGAWALGLHCTRLHTVVCIVFNCLDPGISDPEPAYSIL